MPGRKFNSNAYKYGFNGKENDGSGASASSAGEGTQDYGMRIYNPALGRFLSVDPLTKKYPELTPYQFASNRPIDGIDIDGLEWGGPMDPNGMSMHYFYMGEIAKKNGEDPVEYVRTQSRNYGIAYTAGAIGGVVFMYGGYRLLPVLRPLLPGAIVGGVTNSAISAMKGESATKITTSFASGFVSGLVLGSGASATFLQKAATGGFAGVIGEYTQQILDINTKEKKDEIDFLKVMEAGGLGSLASGAADILKEKISNYVDKIIEQEVTRLISKENVSIFIADAKKLNPNLTQRELTKYAKSELLQAVGYAEDYGINLKITLFEMVNKSMDVINSKIQDKAEQLRKKK